MFANIPMTREEFQESQRLKKTVHKEVFREKKENTVQLYDKLGVKKSENMTMEEAKKFLGCYKDVIVNGARKDRTVGGYIVRLNNETL